MSHRPPKHGPNRLSRYLAIHDTVMRQFYEQGFVGEDSLEFIDLKKAGFIQGVIGCQGQLLISVDKELEYLDDEQNDPRVQTLAYSYNVSLAGRGNIFRYDNAHSYPSHADEHHKHRFDWKTGDQLFDSPSWVGADHWPTLGEVIEEVRKWHSQNYAELPHPEAFPEQLSEWRR